MIQHQEWAAGALRGTLARARRIWRASEGLARGLAWLGAALVALLLLAFADHLFDLPGWLRLGLGLGYAAAVFAALAAWVLRPIFWRINDQAAAVYLEGKLGARDNLLINAVQLQAFAREEQPRIGSAAMIRRIVGEASSRAATLKLGALWERRRLRNLCVLAGAALLALFALAAGFPEHAANALERFTRPLSGVPLLARTRVLAWPEHSVEVLSGERLTVHGTAYVPDGAAPREMALLAELPEGTRRIPMSAAPAAHPELPAPAGLPAASFVYEFPNVNASFRFTLASDDGRSRPCEVRVRAKPRVKDVELELQPPVYTGLPARSESAPSGLIHTLPGSKAKLIFTPSLELKAGTLRGPGGAVPLQPAGEGRWAAALDVDSEGAYSVALASADGVEAPRAFEGQVLLRADALPTVFFENRSLNVPAAPGATVPLAVRAQDDYGLASLQLIVRRSRETDQGAEEPFTTLKRWTFPVPGEKSANEVFALKLDPADFAVGATYVVHAEAADHAPKGARTTRSAPLVIRVLTPEQMGLKPDSLYRTAFERLQKLIEMQTQARGKTVTILEFLDEVAKSGALPKRLVSVREAQVKIREETGALVAHLDAGLPREKKDQAAPLAKELRELFTGPMDRAVGRLVGCEQVHGGGATTVDLLQSERELPEEILNRLTALLGVVAGLDRDKPPPRADLKDDQDGQRLRDKLEAAQEKLKAFLDAEKKILDSTEELAKKQPDDLTEEDKKKFGELAEEEKNWAKFFREAFTDLSKVPDQDFSNSGLAEEFNEVFQEIQKAAEALGQKNAEIAVRNEEAGLELAKNLETNLEKWLPDAKDSTKWSMEEPQGEFDVPLADLPKELEDIIGELVDKEEEMTEDVQDVSSSWMDSMDKGAGWDATDGPISNMSAKGVTGNQLPNQQEIGGRSGEGRSGKSSGQFVEQSADGKGGPQTPARVTPDPYEEGQVDDQSKDPVGGSTGGGKSSGTAGEGLRGTPPPEIKAKLDRLKGMQAELRQKAEKIETTLKAYHLPSSDMAEAVRRMKELEANLASGRGFNLRQAQSQLVEQLKDAQRAVGFKAEINLERSRELPKRVREEILSGMRGQAPQGYQDLLEAYYKALVETDEP